MCANRQRYPRTENRAKLRRMVAGHGKQMETIVENARRGTYIFTDNLTRTRQHVRSDFFGFPNFGFLFNEFEKYLWTIFKLTSLIHWLFSIGNVYFSEPKREPNSIPTNDLNSLPSFLDECHRYFNKNHVQNRCQFLHFWTLVAVLCFSFLKHDVFK